MYDFKILKFHIVWHVLISSFVFFLKIAFLFNFKFLFLEHLFSHLCSNLSYEHIAVYSLTMVIISNHSLSDAMFLILLGSVRDRTKLLGDNYAQS